MERPVRILAQGLSRHASNLVWPFGSPDPRENAFSERVLELLGSTEDEMAKEAVRALVVEVDGQVKE